MPPVADTQLAEQYGVPVALITQHRETVLKEGLDWSRDGKRVVWYAPGLTAVAEMVSRLGLTPEKKDGGATASSDAPSGSGQAGEGEDSAPAPEAALESPAPRTGTARILSKYPNRIWVRAHLPGENNGMALDVRVRNNRNLAKNALLPVQLHPGGTWICTHPQHSPKPF